MFVSFCFSFRTAFVGEGSQMVEGPVPASQHALQPQLVPSFFPTGIVGSPRTGQGGAGTTGNLLFLQREAPDSRWRWKPWWLPPLPPAVSKHTSRWWPRRCARVSSSMSVEGIGFKESDFGARDDDRV